eukprot:403352154
MAVSPLNGGTLIQNYRKTNLFVDDLTWASAGDGFKTFDLTFPKRNNISVRCMQAVCADIDPHNPKNETQVCELGEFAQRNQVELIFFSTTWVFENDYVFKNETQATKDTLDYWTSRLSPLVQQKQIEDGFDHQITQNKVCYLLAADNVGVEKGIDKAGSSCVIQFDRTSGTTQVLSHLNMRENNILRQVIQL